MELTETQKQRLLTDGFVKLPGIVPSELVANALRAINASLGSRGMDPQQLPVLQSQTYCPEITRTAVITRLYNESPLRSIAESLIGENKILPIDYGQIALRFPTMSEPRQPHPHLDGMYTPHNGVPAGAINSFTALIGVFLSDVPHELMGNFTVWPGTHHLYENYFRQHGSQALLNGMPSIDLPAPQQVTVKAGDAALVHYQLGHGIASNISPYTRYALFFRLLHVDHESVKWECMTDIWREWPGMQNVAV